MTPPFQVPFNKPNNLKVVLKMGPENGGNTKRPCPQEKAWSMIINKDWHHEKTGREKHKNIWWALFLYNKECRLKDHIIKMLN